MILSALEINNDGTTELFIETTLPRTSELLDGKEPLKIEQNLSQGYKDISSIETFAKYGDSLIGNFTNFMDWKCLRSEIKKLANLICDNDIGSTTKFALLNSEEKKIVCQYLTNIVSSTDFTSTYPVAVQRAGIGLNFDSKSTDARHKRVYIMRGYLMSKIGGANGILFLNDCIKEGRIEAYIGGIESKSEDNVDGFYDIIDGINKYVSGNTPKGLRHRDYTITDGSNDDINNVCDGLIVIMDGFY